PGERGKEVINFPNDYYILGGGLYQNGETTISFNVLRIKEVRRQANLGEIFDFPFIRCYLLLWAFY
ncbi:MAG: hypothetical protein KAW42_06835, partial [Candidatus Atribacteria bacterium]|nr:hypothetical protein [Candidatus Atribacteria bacterium]